MVLFKFTLEFDSVLIRMTQNGCCELLQLETGAENQTNALIPALTPPSIKKTILWLMRNEDYNMRNGNLTHNLDNLQWKQENIMGCGDIFHSCSLQTGPWNH